MYGPTFWGVSALFDPLRPFLGLASLLPLATTHSPRVRTPRPGCPVRLAERERVGAWRMPRHGTDAHRESSPNGG